LLPGKLPESLCISIGGRQHHWELGDGARYTEQEASAHQGWKAGSGQRPSTRHRLFMELWQLLQTMPDATRKSVLEDIRAWAGARPFIRPTHSPLTVDELAECAHHGLFQLGAHTVSHPALKALTPSAQREEIAQSKVRLQEIAQRPITKFSYPHGEWSEDTIALVRECEFTSAYTTEPRAITNGADPFRLPRIAVSDCDGDAFARRLDTWLSQSQ
jgi:peptidoglycan/xylan/chitin deacetylase (PgdA/CDA1 family)